MRVSSSFNQLIPLSFFFPCSFEEEGGERDSQKYKMKMEIGEGEDEDGRVKIFSVDDGRCGYKNKVKENGKGEWGNSVMLFFSFSLSFFWKLDCTCEIEAAWMICIRRRRASVVDAL